MTSRIDLDSNQGFNKSVLSHFHLIILVTGRLVQKRLVKKLKFRISENDLLCVLSIRDIEFFKNCVSSKYWIRNTTFFDGYSYITIIKLAEFFHVFENLNFTNFKQVCSKRTSRKQNFLKVRKKQNLPNVFIPNAMKQIKSNVFGTEPTNLFFK